MATLWERLQPPPTGGGQPIEICTGRLLWLGRLAAHGLRSLRLWESLASRLMNDSRGLAMAAEGLSVRLFVLGGLVGVYLVGADLDGPAEYGSDAPHG